MSCTTCPRGTPVVSEVGSQVCEGCGAVLAENALVDRGPDGGFVEGTRAVKGLGEIEIRGKGGRLLGSSTSWKEKAWKTRRDDAIDVQKGICRSLLLSGQIQERAAFLLEYCFNEHFIRGSYNRLLVAICCVHWACRERNWPNSLRDLTDLVDLRTGYEGVLKMAVQLKAKINVKLHIHTPVYVTVDADQVINALRLLISSKHRAIPATEKWGVGTYYYLQVPSSKSNRDFWGEVKQLSNQLIDFLATDLNLFAGRKSSLQISITIVVIAIEGVLLAKFPARKEVIESIITTIDSSQNKLLYGVNERIRESHRAILDWHTSSKLPPFMDLSSGKLSNQQGDRENAPLVTKTVVDNLEETRRKRLVQSLKSAAGQRELDDQALSTVGSFDKQAKIVDWRLTAEVGPPDEEEIANADSEDFFNMHSKLTPRPQKGSPSCSSNRTTSQRSPSRNASPSNSNTLPPASLTSAAPVLNTPAVEPDLLIFPDDAPEPLLLDQEGLYAFLSDDNSDASVVDGPPPASYNQPPSSPSEITIAPKKASQNQSLKLIPVVEPFDENNRVQNGRPAGYMRKRDDTYKKRPGQRFIESPHFVAQLSALKDRINRFQPGEPEFTLTELARQLVEGKSSADIDISLLPHSHLGAISALLPIGEELLDEELFDGNEFDFYLRPSEDVEDYAKLKELDWDDEKHARKPKKRLHSEESDDVIGQEGAVGGLHFGGYRKKTKVTADMLRLAQLAFQQGEKEEDDKEEENNDNSEDDWPAYLDPLLDPHNRNLIDVDCNEMNMTNRVVYGDSDEMLPFLQYK